MFGRLSDWWEDVVGPEARETSRNEARRVLAAALPQVRLVDDPEPTDWLRATLQIPFAYNVASMLPGDFEAYAEVYNPFVYDDGSNRSPVSWQSIVELLGITDRREVIVNGMLPHTIPDGIRSDQGSLAPTLVDALISHLAPATATPDDCYFAVWNGFGATIIPRAIDPTLHLPWRSYHVFSGPLAAAHTSYDAASYSFQSANLWWPADHAWCVATDVDFHWSYVGGTRACIDALVRDVRLEALHVTASFSWGAR